MTVARFEWLQDGDFIQGGPHTRNDAANLRIAPAAPGALSGPIEFEGFGTTSPGNVTVHVYSDLDENRAPSGSQERIDCSIPQSADPEKCEWYEGSDGLSLTVRPIMDEPAALTLTAVYTILLDQLPENSVRTVAHATWVITR
nr:hypothetical protein [Actinomycetales bacterium]